MRLTLCILVIAAAASPARAQPPPEPTGYPVDISQRPLLLPSGLFEVGAEARTFWFGGESGFGPGAFDYVLNQLTARAGLGPVEARLSRWPAASPSTKTPAPCRAARPA